ncbi:MAG TPA: hypothetical protein VH912_27855 [Streptosporangiaceae bacterium]
MSVASLSVGFILGWIVARPKRWEYMGDEPIVRPDDLTRLPRLTSGGAAPL